MSNVSLNHTNVIFFVRTIPEIRIFVEIIILKDEGFTQIV